MNDKDLEAFECWQKEIIQELKFNNAIGDNKHKGSLEFAWQAACEYKQKEYSNIMDAMTQTSQYNFKLQAENKKLREKLETAKIIFIEMNDKDKEILEWKEAARSEAEEVNKLQSEVKRRKERYDKVRKILITWIRWQEREIYKNPQLGNIRIHNIIRQAREALKEITTN
jgi:hypothetical protein